MSHATQPYSFEDILDKIFKELNALEKDHHRTYEKGSLLLFSGLFSHLISKTLHHFFAKTALEASLADLIHTPLNAFIEHARHYLPYSAQFITDTKEAASYHDVMRSFLTVMQEIGQISSQALHERNFTLYLKEQPGGSLHPEAIENFALKESIRSLWITYLSFFTSSEEVKKAVFSHAKIQGFSKLPFTVMPHETSHEIAEKLLSLVSFSGDAPLKTLQFISKELSDPSKIQGKFHTSIASECYGRFFELMRFFAESADNRSYYFGMQDTALMNIQSVQFCLQKVRAARTQWGVLGCHFLASFTLGALFFFTPFTTVLTSLGMQSLLTFLIQQSKFSHFNSPRTVIRQHFFATQHALTYQCLEEDTVSDLPIGAINEEFVTELQMLVTDLKEKNKRSLVQRTVSILSSFPGVSAISIFILFLSLLPFLTPEEQDSLIVTWFKSFLFSLFIWIEFFSASVYFQKPRQLR